MGNELSQIDDGFFICGVEALVDTRRLKTLGVTHVLNVARSDLYKSKFVPGEIPLGEKLKVRREILAFNRCSTSFHFPFCIRRPTPVTDGDQHQRQQTTRANHAVYDPIFIQYIIITFIANYLAAPQRSFRKRPSSWFGYSPDAHCVCVLF
jgi:hypothetical protein